MTLVDSPIKSNEHDRDENPGDLLNDDMRCVRLGRTSNSEHPP